MKDFKKIHKMADGGFVDDAGYKYEGKRDIHRVYDRDNNLVSKEFDDAKTARRYADNLDKKYGASAHTVKQTTIPVGKPISGGGGGSSIGGGAEIKSLANPRAMKRGGKVTKRK